jgi:hypothetical protein
LLLVAVAVVLMAILVLAQAVVALVDSVREQDCLLPLELLTQLQ